ncbi:unnamed protein product, partial [Musa hybrid cultivar]
MYTCIALMAIHKTLTLVSLIPFFDGHWISGRDLDVACLLGAPFHIPFLVAVPIGAADLVTVGDKGPGQVHGDGGEGAAPNTEEEADHDHEDVFGAISEGAEPEGGGLGGGDLAAGEEEPRPRDHGRARVGVEGGADGGDDAVDGDESVGTVVTGEGSVGSGGDGVGDEDSVARVEGDPGASSGGGSEKGEDDEEEGEGGARGSHSGISGAKEDGKNWSYRCGI